MRALRLVDTRRDGQTIYYRLASREVRGVLERCTGSTALPALTCAGDSSGAAGASTAAVARGLRLPRCRAHGHRNASLLARTIAAASTPKYARNAARVSLRPKPSVPSCT